ncbi:MAG TPA: tetratricopeptide repeat protein [Syntrophorhabdaceae bacterium]|nr:tetratricopeptide repeat protein [Syntrophorhabdaceae bacterium]
MKKLAAISLAFIFILILVSFSQAQTLFDKGVKEFNQENYEEALPYFLQAREAEKGSSRIAFYVGLTYKFMEKYHEAIPYFKDAATLSPRVDDAVVELVDVQYHTGNLGEAQKWIALADKEGIGTARLNFLKGMVLAKVRKPDDAIQAFETASRLDPRLTQQAELQIAGIYAEQGKYKDAQARLRATITLDPASDMALYARDYEKIIADRAEREKTWHFAVGMGYKYDTNVVTVGEGPMTDLISGVEGGAMNFGARIGYTAPFSFRTPFSFSAYYSMYADRYFGKTYTRSDGSAGNLTEYNNMANTFSIVPGYSWGRFGFTLPLTYSYISLQGVKGDNFYNEFSWWNQTRYLETQSVTPTLRFITTQNSFGEVFFSYMRKKYFDTELHPEPPEGEERSGDRFTGGLGWTYTFKENKGFVTLRYSHAEDNTIGRNWVSSENRFGIDVLCPIVGPLRVQGSADATYVKYTYDNIFFGEKRRDDIYSVNVALLYGIVKNTDLILQYNYWRNQSNIALYDYTREIYGLGVEYRF